MAAIDKKPDLAHRLTDQELAALEKRTYQDLQAVGQDEKNHNNFCIYCGKNINFRIVQTTETIEAKM